MPKIYEKKSKLWSTDQVQRAILEIRSGGSIRGTALKYGMAEATLRYKLKRHETGVSKSNIGRPTALTDKIEKELASCIGVLCKVGFSPTIPEILELVSKYVRTNEIEAFSSGKPGKDWFHGFVKRNNLSLKKANIISSARKSATANPFIVYDFYEQVEEIIEKKGLGDAQIWNCDETGFPSDPAKCKVLGVKGEPAYKVTCGAGRENTTTLAVCSAAGKALDPFIIFSGKNLQSTWRGQRALPGTWYGVSENGWMTTELFEEWFSKFVTEVTIRPLLLIFDGHLTHISIEVIKKAQNEDITIVKLPPHVTDKLQPLDVSCFGPLKRLWEKELNTWVNEFGPREPIRKAQFVNKLCDVWHKGLSPDNIKSGFMATGIFPLDRSKFPESRFDHRLLLRYRTWVQAGRPKEILEDLACGVKALSPKKTSTPQKTSTPKKASPRKRMLQETKESNICSCGLLNKLGPVPCEAPPGKVWVPVWHLAEKETGKNKSFEDLILEKMKGPTEKPKVKRRKIDLMTKVITDEEYLEAINAKLPKERTAKKDFEQKATDTVKESNKEDEQEMEEEVDNPIVYPPGSRRQAEVYLRFVWENLNPPTLESDVIDKWYAASFTGKKKEHLYIGKAKRRFLCDEGGPATGIELDCLKPPTGSGSTLKAVPCHLPRDIDIVPIYNIIAGPLVVRPLKGDKWEVPEIENVRKTFGLTSKLDRETLYNGLFN